MKKSLIAMAFMLGAVVIVASCKSKKEDPCTKCTVKVSQTSGTKVNSVAYATEQCKEAWTAPAAIDQADITANNANKGGTYVCE